MQSSARRYLVLVSLLFLSAFTFNYVALAQSRPQRPEQPAGTGKKNQRPKPKTEEELKKEAEERKGERKKTRHRSKASSTSKPT